MTDSAHGLTAQQLATAKGELHEATQAFGRGDLMVASLHLADALSFDPVHPEARALLDRMLGSTPDPLVLTPVAAGRVNFATAAVRAYTYARLQQWTEALEWIARVVQVRPDIHYLEWVPAWLQPSLLQQVPFATIEATLLATFLEVVDGAPSPMQTGDPRLRNVRAAVEICEGLRAAHAPQPALWSTSSAVARRMGDLSGAVEMAHHAYSLGASRSTCVELARAYRAAGHVDHAVSTFRHALQSESEQAPSGLALRVEAADTLLDAERFAEALPLYDEVVQLDAEQTGALAASLYARFRVHGNPEDRVQLLRLRGGLEHDARATELADRLDPPVACINYLPGPADATAAGVREALAAMESSEDQVVPVRLSVDVLESPSVLCALEVGARRLGKQATLEVEVEGIPQPDPRVPKSAVDFVVWQYEGTSPRKAMAPANDRLQDAVARIAADALHPELWDPAARALGRQLGAQWLMGLVSVMTDPPDPPDPTWDPVIWVQRVQLAAALTISHVDDGWEASYRRRALYSLIGGPVDWVVDAAIVAAAWRAREDEGIRRDVESMFGWLEKTIPAEGFTCFEYPLVCAWLALGDHPEPTQQRLQAWRERVEQRSPGKSVAHQPPTRVEGITLEQYAAFVAQRDALLAKHGFVGALMAAAGKGPLPELLELCRAHGIRPQLEQGRLPSITAARVPAWDVIIADNHPIGREFHEHVTRARLASQGIDPDGAQAQQVRDIQQGNVDMHQQMAAAQQAQRQVAEGAAGDPDPVVFPGQPLAKLSDYVGLMKQMQTGDMHGALARYGLDMGSYAQAAQAWGTKLAADATLSAKFAQMMAG